MRIEFDIEATPEELKALLPSIEIEDAIEFDEPAPAQPPRTMADVLQRLRAFNEQLKSKAEAATHNGHCSANGSAKEEPFLKPWHYYRTRDGQTAYVLGRNPFGQGSYEYALAIDGLKGVLSCCNAGAYVGAEDHGFDLVECLGTSRPEPSESAGSEGEAKSSEPFLKAGHYYRKRGGDVVYVVGRNPLERDENEWLGVELEKGGDVDTWSGSGSYFASGKQAICDLVEDLGTSAPIPRVEELVD